MAEKKGLKSRLFHKSEKPKKEEEDKYKYEKQLLKMAVDGQRSGNKKGDPNSNQQPQNMAEAAYTFMEQANNPPTTSRRHPNQQKGGNKQQKGKGGKKGGKVSTAMKVASFVSKHK